MKIKLNKEEEIELTEREQQIYEQGQNDTDGSIGFIIGFAIGLTIMVLVLIIKL